MTITLTPTHDPRGYLSSPSVPGDGAFVGQLEQKAGPIIGGLDGVIHSITGFSPLAEWVIKPFAGDWNALDRGAVAWTGAGKAMTAIGDNVKSLPKQIGDSWTGETADAFTRAQAKVCTAITHLPASCDAMSKMCAALASAAKAIAEFVAELLGDLADFVTEMLISLAVPIAGEAAMPAWIAELLAEIGEAVPELSGMIESFSELVEELPEIIENIKKAIDEVQKILELLSSLASLAGSVVDASADADAVLG
jgi:methyl-accepting chemotaxis protein